MDKNQLRNLAEKNVEDFFESIDDFVNDRVAKIAEIEHIVDEDDINYLKKKIMRGILKLD